MLIKSEGKGVYPAIRRGATKRIFMPAFVGALIGWSAALTFAQTDTWRIYRNGEDIQMKRQYDYDPSNRYRGYIENDGYTRMRNYDGDTLKGYIDSDGYGKLRDDQGNTYRVRPR